MSRRWYVHNGTIESGPFSTPELLSMSKNGGLLQSHKVRSGEREGWVKATKVRGLVFGDQNPGEKLATAYRAEATKIANAISGMPKQSDHRNKAVDFLKSHCKNESLIEVCANGSAEDLQEYALHAMGNDLLYWIIVSILADGVVQAEELSASQPLVREIQKSYVKSGSSLASFSCEDPKSAERFLASFKRERKEMFSNEDSQEELFSGGFLAVAGAICSPRLAPVDTYSRIVEFAISMIIMVEGVAPEEKLLMARAKAVHQKFRDYSNRPIVAESASPLLDSANEIVETSDAPYHFRKTRWGMSKKDVLTAEQGEPSDVAENVLMFSGRISNLSCEIIYIFVEGVLTRSKYWITETHSNDNRFLSDYGVLRELLCKKYGTPEEGGEDWLADVFWCNELYQDDYDDWGLAVSIGHVHFLASWESEFTSVHLGLTGDNYDVRLAIEYTGKEFEHLEDKINEASALEDL